MQKKIGNIGRKEQKDIMVTTFRRQDLFIPQLFQNNTPEPTDPSVKIYSYSGTAIVKRFGGYIMEDSLWMMYADEFRF